MANSKKELKVLYKNLNELQENPKNSRVHSEKQVAQIAKSIDSFGFNNPVLIDQNGVIIAGHGRYLAAKELEFEEIPTVCLSHMTPDQINKDRHRSFMLKNMGFNVIRFTNEEVLKKYN